MDADHVAADHVGIACTVHLLQALARKCVHILDVPLNQYALERAARIYRYRASVDQMQLRDSFDIDDEDPSLRLGGYSDDGGVLDSVVVDALLNGDLVEKTGGGAVGCQHKNGAGHRQLGVIYASLWQHDADKFL